MPGRSRNDLLLQLQTSSRLVRHFRHRQLPEQATRELDKLVADHPRSPLLPAWLHWQLDNCVLAADRDQVVERAEAIIRRFSTRKFNGCSWAARALDTRATLQARTGHFEAALKDCARLAGNHAGETALAELYFEIARMAERTGHKRIALTSYREALSQAIDEEDYSGIHLLARAYAQRLEHGIRWGRPDPQQLADELSRIIDFRDYDQLHALASRTVFRVGTPYGEPAFVDPGPAVESLIKVFKASEKSLRAGVLEKFGDGYRLPVHGCFINRRHSSLYLLFGSFNDLWEWGGMVAEGVSGAVGNIAGGDIESFFQGCATEFTTSNALTLEIKAPWPAGTSCAAGGLLTGGLYYNQAPTHCGSAAFAVDFARSALTFGIPVLSVFQGIVANVTANISDNDTSGTANRVRINHYTDADLLLNLLIKLFGGDDYEVRYQTRYLHLRGPDLIPVSVGMWVDQGTRIGEMDHTGRSMAPHLHFELRDRDEIRNGNRHATIMPSPMDGVPLGLNDAGTWITSTNEMAP